VPRKAGFDHTHVLATRTDHFANHFVASSHLAKCSVHDATEDKIRINANKPFVLNSKQIGKFIV